MLSRCKPTTVPLCMCVCVATTRRSHLRRKFYVCIVFVYVCVENRKINKIYSKSIYARVALTASLFTQYQPLYIDGFDSIRRTREQTQRSRISNNAALCLILTHTHTQRTKKIIENRIVSIREKNKDARRYSADQGWQGEWELLAPRWEGKNCVLVHLVVWKYDMVLRASEGEYNDVRFAGCIFFCYSSARMRMTYSAILCARPLSLSAP